MPQITISPALATAAIALIAVFVAWQQWRTARHKLSLDLFDRRIAAYRKLNQTATERHSEILGLTFDQATREPPSSALSAFWAAKSEAYFLFGPDVHRAMDRLEAKLATLLNEKSEFTVNSINTPLDYSKVLRASANVFGAQDYLLETVKPYMMMGTIGVARPRSWRRKVELGESIEHGQIDQHDQLFENLASGSDRSGRSASASTDTPQDRES